MTKASRNVEDMSLEEAIGEIESIASALEAGRTSLEESLELFERGISLLKSCTIRLEKAERRIESLTGELPADLDG